MELLLIILIPFVSLILYFVVKQKRKFGTYEIKDDILKIKNTNSEDRILFHDISSINNKLIKKPNFLFLSLSLISNDSPLIILQIITVIISLILCFIFRISWDQISIESRGGKIIKFNVKKGFGNAIAEKIENYKRNLKSSSIIE